MSRDFSDCEPGMCIIAYVDSAGEGGPSSHFWGLMKHLPGHFCDLHVVMPEDVDGELECPVHRVPASRGVLGRMLLAYSMAKAARRVADEHEIRLFYARSLMNSLFLGVRRNKGEHLVLEMNGLWSEEHGGIFSRKILRFLENRVVKKASLVICVSEGIKSEMVARGHPCDKLVVVENGVDTDIFRPVEGSKTSIAKRYGLSHDAKLVVFVGSLYPWQGVDTAIDAMKIVAEKEPNSVLLVVGDGTERDALEKSVVDSGLQGSVIFCGMVSHTEVPEHISAADVCIALKKPLKSGYSPLKLYEYMACGKPVVASRVSGFEFIESEGTGLLVPPGDPIKTSHEILKLLGDPEMSRELGHRAGRYVLEGHTWKDVAENIADACRRLLE